MPIVKKQILIKSVFHLRFVPNTIDIITTTMIKNGNHCFRNPKKLSKKEKRHIRSIILMEVRVS
jgi:hypothetical protein